MQAWWSGTVGDFRDADPARIMGALSVRLVETHPLNRATQIQAWRAEIDILQTALSHASAHWRLLLEYPLLRLGRRIDAVLLTDRCVLVLEFKVGSITFTNLDRQQVEDYALDILDFHSGSRAHPIVPILVATKGQPRPIEWPLIWHGVTQVFDTSSYALGQLLQEIEQHIPATSHKLDIATWEAAPYRPVPTIVEAAHAVWASWRGRYRRGTCRRQQSDTHDHRDPSGNRRCAWRLMAHGHLRHRDPWCRQDTVRAECRVR